MKMFTANSFDVAFMMDVLEHVPELHKAIKEVLRVLKKGGFLVLCAPFVIPIHDAPYDYFRFTKYGLELLLKDFSSLNLREKNDYLHSVIVQISRMLKTETRKSVFFGAILFLVTLIWYPVLFIFSKLIDSRYSTTGYFVVAKK